MGKTTCPVCGSDHVKIALETLDEFEALRGWECRDCESTWEIRGEPIVIVTSAVWEKTPSNIQYGPDVDLEQMAIDAIMREAEAKTLPLFEVVSE